MKLRVRAFGLAVGIVWGLGIFVATIWAVLKGTGNTLILLIAYYPGYSITYGGALVGLFWGFINGIICGSLISWLYNMLHKWLYKS